MGHAGLSLTEEIGAREGAGDQRTESPRAAHFRITDDAPAGERRQIVIGEHTAREQRDAERRRERRAAEPEQRHVRTHQSLRLRQTPSSDLPTRQPKSGSTPRERGHEESIPDPDLCGRRMAGSQQQAVGGRQHPRRVEIPQRLERRRRRREARNIARLPAGNGRCPRRTPCTTAGARAPARGPLRRASRARRRAPTLRDRLRCARGRRCRGRHRRPEPAAGRRPCRRSPRGRSPGAPRRASSRAGPRDRDRAPGTSSFAAVRHRTPVSSRRCPRRLRARRPSGACRPETGDTPSSCARARRRRARHRCRGTLSSG